MRLLRYFTAFEWLVKPTHTPIFATTLSDMTYYANGYVNGVPVNGVDVAMELGWRILDRGGVARLLHFRVHEVHEESER